MTLHCITVVCVKHVDRLHHFKMKGTVISMYSGVCGTAGIHKYSMHSPPPTLFAASPPPYWRCVHPQPTMFMQNNPAEIPLMADKHSKSVHFIV